MKKYRFLISTLFILFGLSLFILSYRNVYAGTYKVPFKTPAGTWTADRCSGYPFALVNGWCWRCPTGPVGLPAECKVTGTGANSYCSDTGYIPGQLCAWELWTATPAPTDKSIMFGGKVAFNGTDGKATDCAKISNISGGLLKYLVGTKIALYDESNSKKLAETTAAYDEVTKTVKYQLSADKVASNSYKIVATKDGYFDQTYYPDQSVTTSDKLISLPQDVLMIPKNVRIYGVVVDSKTKTNIANVEVDKEPTLEKKTVSNKDGYGFMEKITDSTLVLQGYTFWATGLFSRYEPVEMDIPTYCPVNYAKVEMLTKMGCNKPTSQDVEFCWWGDKALALKDNPVYSNVWVDVSNRLTQLKNKLSIPSPKTVNVMGYDRWSAYSREENKQIYFSSLMFTDQLNYKAMNDFVINHETAHLYNYAHPSEINSVFDALLREGGVLIKSNPAYGATTVYMIMTADWGYYISGPKASSPFGYAGTNQRELYAETFATMYGFDAKMHQAITQNPATPAEFVLPADIRAYAKKVHNAAATTFPHGNTIAIEDFVNRLVAAIK